MAKHHRNVGIFAHVDAGKTTTTEQILYQSGVIRALGSVNEGTAFTDSLDIEKQRGISVKAAATSFVWKNCTVNLVDTPGHIDFISEVERSLRVMDGATLIISAADGVQAQTETIWKALRKLHIPTIIYVNKMDRPDISVTDIMNNITSLLSPAALPVQQIQFDQEVLSDAVSIFTADGIDAREEHNIIAEWLADQDEEFLERFIEGEDISRNELHDRIAAEARHGNAFPVCFGSSQKGIGIQELMEAIIDYLPGPAGNADGPLSGVVFKVERDKSMGRAVYIRLYNGKLHTRDTVTIMNRGLEEKVTQIRKLEGRKAIDLGQFEAGDIAAVYGLHEAQIGDIIGSEAYVPPLPGMAVPLLTVQVHCKDAAQYPSLIAALQELTDEDPLLGLTWLKDERELHLKVMGSIQLEILESILLSRFGLAVTFDPPSVIYKETPAAEGEGYIAYTMPKPCWAVLRFAIRPLPRGSGLVYRSEVRYDHLLERYQNEVARRVPEALEQGLYGWEVTDLEVVLTYGEHHVWHTHPLDFVVATPMGIMDGLDQVRTTLLEPMQHFRIIVPEENGGKVLSELVHMRAVFEAPYIAHGRCTVEGIIPVATSLNYPVQLRSETKGSGIMTTSYAGYQACPEGISATRKRRGVDPRDQSRYILAVRNAISSS
ncbi:TetM/TetW/TetO/TetS family tetracycline resistance ribosomal protection protein [Paenibacillus urinalis]|uniref:TetM/TetW/TetO/TetS family tetracycline resistance ribosomal protection protein n=1 Tax=Paenibacillus urinalis TaxID=521520 RepID=A0ABY7XES9_9BACL|nr:TetM/TetW/TetO/TetS family tetracycline resistance ribosomal protection protein [Paenibacillus urinalis]WDI04108.1 TetM/TetW/TetO/TetS family tetracycline resistance ribosomal protection protein [Paenibacillus urinalis]